MDNLETDPFSINWCSFESVLKYAKELQSLTNRVITIVKYEGSRNYNLSFDNEQNRKKLRENNGMIVWKGRNG